MSDKTYEQPGQWDEPIEGHSASANLAEPAAPERCDVCGAALEFPADDDPMFAGDTAVTSKCRHVIRVRPADPATPQLHSKLPWRSVYPVGSKQRCAAVESAADDVYVYLHVAKSDDLQETVDRWKADADFIATACNNYSAALSEVATLKEENANMRTYSHETVRGLVDHRDAEITRLQTELAASQKKMDALQQSHDGLLKATGGLLDLFCDPSSFYIKKLGAPITNADQDKIDAVFVAAQEAIALAEERDKQWN